MPNFLSKYCISALNNKNAIQIFGLYTTNRHVTNHTTTRKRTHRMPYLILIIVYKKEVVVMIMKMITTSGRRQMIFPNHPILLTNSVSMAEMPILILIVVFNVRTSTIRKVKKSFHTYSLIGYISNFIQSTVMRLIFHYFKTCN